ncbi:locomotion-related protein Hikaru genki [Strongylocentrotus purpuratus]|uniref:Uncharacterized protein n=1 Tax=Strongylocentrotus purpuratus TaxID=7668 RepID=A0A7M7NGN5_STRPU|nr:locomotion-related protein Hikaru genki [Strongylocentrotus purpuratus]
MVQFAHRIKSPAMRKKPCLVPRNRGPVRQFVNGDARRPISSYYTPPTLPDGTKLVVRCRDPGMYRLIGDQRRICQGGQWTGDEPECQPVETQVLFYGAPHEVASNGTVVVYVHRGNPNYLDVVCFITSLWLGPPRLTTPLVNDGDLWDWPRLYTDTKRLNPISTDFSGMYTCNGSSSFHSVHVLFKAAECDVPAAPEHGRLLDGSRQQARDIFPAGATVSFECEDDYSLVGSRQITCEKGQWLDDPPVCTVLPSSGAVIRGIVETTENYTAALEDTTSLAYKKFEKKFIDAIMRFYAQNHPEYIAYHEDTKVTDFEKSGRKAIVHFEVHFSQLDNDSILPDAHTVLLDQVNTGQLGPFSITMGTVTKTET